MDGGELLARHFEVHRAYLHRIALRILGSPDAAEEAVAQAWERVNLGEESVEEDATAWLRTVVARTCLDILRTRRGQRVAPREPYDTGGFTGTVQTDQEAAIADSISLALLVALDRLTPTERLAFVLHDVFSVPMDEIAGVVGRTPDVAERLYDRARARVHQLDIGAAAEIARRCRAVEQFLSASRTGAVEALLQVLDPGAVLRVDEAAAALGAQTARGAQEVSGIVAGRAREARSALIDGVPGAVWAPDGTPRAAFLFSVERSRITEIEMVADPARLARMRFHIRA